VYYYAGLEFTTNYFNIKAKEILEMGLDYLVKTSKLEINFSIQLGRSLQWFGRFQEKVSTFQSQSVLKQ
jgi:hypothetical protein